MTLIMLQICLLVFAVSALRSFSDDRVISLPNYGPLLSPYYAGYLQHSDGTQSYYIFIESESRPSVDPVVLWLNGGPGCSSLIGFSTENGPYTVRNDNKFYLNDYRWTTNTSLLYLESPPGVGYSLDPKNGEWTDAKTAASNYAALQLWYARFPQFATNPLFLSGESYAGHYVPQLANEILIGQDVNLRQRMRGFMVGNPCTGDIGCGNNDPTLDVYLRNHAFLPLNASIPSSGATNYDPYDILVPTCPDQQVSRMVQWPHPVMDALKKRVGARPEPYDPCADGVVTAWFNQADVKAALHANAQKIWNECGGVNYRFNASSVVGLYETFFKQTNWSLMIYSGTADTVVNFIQTQTIVTQQMKSLRLMKPYTQWNYPDDTDPTATQLGGFALLYDRFSWASVNDAGHMVPQFNPPAAKELFMSFITTGKPGRKVDSPPSTTRRNRVKKSTN